MSDGFDVPLDLNYIESRFQDEDTFKALDIGCGEAQYHQELHQILNSLAKDSDVKIYGIDQDPESVKAARENNEAENFEYLVGSVESSLEEDCQETPLSEEAFDLVIGQHVLCEAQNTQEIYEESIRMAKDGDKSRVYHSTC